MGVYTAPDKFQEQMRALMEKLEFVRVYLDNFIVITSGSFEDHLAKEEEVMKQLQLARFK